MTDSASVFGSALQAAIRRSKEGATPDLTSEQKEAALRQLEVFYESHRASVDAAVEGLLKLEAGAGAGEHAAQLQHAWKLKAPSPDEIETFGRQLTAADAESARALLERDELSPVLESAKAEGVAGLSVGLSFGLSLLLVGAGAGADVLFELNDHKIYGRGFVEVGVGPDILIGLGLNLGIWQTLPTIDRVTYIGGVLIDVPLIEVIGYPVTIRIMAIQAIPKLEDWPDIYTFEGFTFGIWGAALAGFQGFRGAEFAIGLPPLRTSFTVTNCTDSTSPCDPGTAIVDQSKENTMVCTLTNTSEKTITVANGDKMLLKLPRYFSSSDAEAIEVTPPQDWEPPDDPWTKTTLTLNYNGSSLNWSAGDSLEITLDKAKPSGSSPSVGSFSITIPQAEVEGGTIKHAGVAGTSKVNLVPLVETGCIPSWTLECPDFNTNGNATSGTNVKITSQDSQTTVVQLTEITDGNGATWIVGYQFYIDEDGNANFRPCLYKDGTIEVYGKTLDAPNFGYLSETGLTQTASYQNKTGNENYLTTTNVILGDCSSDSDS